MKTNILVGLLLPLFMSSMCKKDYYTGFEVVNMNLRINKATRSIRLGDTLTFTLAIPSRVTSESGVENTVTSVQKGLYGFALNQLDTLNSSANAIKSPAIIGASKGSLDATLSTISTTTAAPFESVLVIVPPARGVYYLQLRGFGALKINSDYESSLRVKFDVADKHWTLLDPYIPGFSTAPGTTALNDQGNGFYCFRVK